MVEENKLGKENFCYTILNDGTIGIAKIKNPRITKRNAKVIKIILDNNEEITCTPDHKFMLKTGKYKHAKDLTTQNILMRTTNAKESYVKEIIALTKLIDVYDIEVPKTHNFALASGVFVHNSAKQGRNREIQAILPLRGKILNVEKAGLDKMLNSEAIKNLITAIGTSFGETFNIDKLRYHKIVIMTDADVDGSHIQTLLLTLFYRYIKPLIVEGKIYIAQPPLFKLIDPLSKGSKYFYSDKELDTFMDGLKKQNIEIEKIHVQRYKGLGEMNADQLWETTMYPKQRVLRKINIDDAIEADRLFSILMGEKVEPRKDFIIEHAKEVKDLDI